MTLARNSASGDPAMGTWQILAGVRFGLAFVVLCSHVWLFVPQGAPLALSWVQVLGGKAAVLGFLLISGYSIAHSLQRSQSGFLTRRFLRVYPLYFVAVVTTAVIAAALGPVIETPHQVFVTSGWKTTAGNFLLLQQFACIPLPLNGVVWSLSVECFYYCLAPLFFRWRTSLLLGIVLASALVYIALGQLHWSALWGVEAATHLWAWLMGFLAYRCRGKWWSLALMLAGGIALLLHPKESAQSLAVVTYTFTACLLFFAPRIPVGPHLGRWSSYLGDISYPLYLFHFSSCFIGYFLFGFRSYGTQIALSLGVSIVAYHLVDVELKRRAIQPGLKKLAAMWARRRILFAAPKPLMP